MADGLTVGLELGDKSGLVMDLPAGYTVDSPSWGVIGDQVTGVPATDSRKLAFTSAAPNPSAGSTNLGFSLPRAGDASVVVTDLQGRLVRRLAAGPMSAGRHDAVWKGRDESGAPVAPGVYFAMLRFENRAIARRLVRVR